jgi:hypothetical protein
MALRMKGRCTMNLPGKAEEGAGERAGGQGHQATLLPPHNGKSGIGEARKSGSHASG